MIDHFVKHHALPGGQPAVSLTGDRLHHQLQMAAEQPALVVLLSPDLTPARWLRSWALPAAPYRRSGLPAVYR